MKAIVTGGAGFIGSNIVHALLREGASVTVIDNFSSARFENLKNFKGEVIAQDINDVLWDKLAPVDVIYHQAALTDTTVSDQKRMMNSNVEGFRKIIEFSLKSKCKIIFASSAAVYGNGAPPQTESGPRNPLNIYGYSKMIADQMAERAMGSHPNQLIGLRYFNVFGAGEQSKGASASMIYQLTEQMRAGKRPRIFVNGEQSRDHIYIKDVVQANLLALKSTESRIVNVGTGNTTNFNRIIELLNEALGTNLSADYFHNPYGFYQNETRADVSAAERLFKFRAKYTVEDGITEYLSELRSLQRSKTTTVNTS